MSDLTVPILAVLGMNATAFAWLANTLWTMNGRLTRLETLAGIEEKKA